MPGMISNIWLLFQPLLFGLIGAQVKIKTIKADTLGKYLYSFNVVNG